MKIIDLLNKIANGESVPLKIKYDKVIWDYDKDSNDYCSDEWLFGDYLGRTTLNEFCNDEIELIEEKKKELPEKLNENFSNYYFDSNNELSNELQDLKITINELIAYIKYKEEEKEK